MEKRIEKHPYLPMGFLHDAEVLSGFQPFEMTNFWSRWG